MHKWARPEAASRIRVFFRTFLFLFTIPVCRAILVNRTIDSNKGDSVTGFVPIYQPQSSWDDQTCSQCMIQPDTAKAFDGTWNAATYLPSLQNVNITLRFTGVAVWVFFILSNANGHGTSTTANTQVNITLDGQYAGSFSHDPDMTTQDLIYNATIFSTSGLANTPHELVIATNDYPNQTFINFDWAIYTADYGASAYQSISLSATTAFPSTTVSSSIGSTPSSTPAPQSSSSKTGVVVGCTLGGLAVIILVLLFFVCRSRRVPQVRYKKTEGILDIDVPPRQPPYGKFQTYRHDPSALSPSEYTLSSPPSSSTLAQSPIPNFVPQSKAARLQEERQRDVNERIQSAQRELDHLLSSQNAGEIVSSSVTGPPQPVSELTSLRNEVRQLRDQIAHLHTQPESPLGLSNEPLPPAYT